MRFKSLWIVLFLFVVRACSILFLDLEWGLMDDAAFIAKFKNAVPPLSLVEFVSSYVSLDLGWGFFRPVNAAWAYWVYALLGVGLGFSPSLLTFLAFLGQVALSWAFAELFSRSAPKESRNESRWLFFGSFWAFTPGLDLIVLLSLQERLVLMGVALSSLCLTQLRHRTLRIWSALFFFLLALASKSTAVGFSLFLAFWAVFDGPSDRQKENLSSQTPFVRWKLGIPFLGAGLLWSVLAAYLAQKGSYTQERFSLHEDLLIGFLRGGGPWMVIVLTVTAAATWIAWKSPERARDLAWPLTTIFLLGLMLPWGVYGYYWTIFLPSFAGSLSLVLRKTLQGSLRKIAWIALAGMIALNLGPKLSRLLQRSVSTRHMVTYLKSDESKEITQFFTAVPCLEAAQSLALLYGRKLGSIRMWEMTNSMKEWNPKTTRWTTCWACPELPTLTDPSLRFVLSHTIGDWKIYRLESIP